MASLDEEIIVIIPARGGSKRIKKKNIFNICNKPMIVWSLLELVKLIDKNKIILSSDDQEIINVVKKFGIDVPFVRPKELSGDHIIPGEAIKHALDWYEKRVNKVKYVLIVYPTAIFLNINDLKKAYSVIKNNKRCSVVFAAKEFSHPIERAIRFDENENIEMIFPEYYKTRTQDFKKSYHDAGQFYLCKSEIIRESVPLFNKNSKFIILPKIRAIDIDNIEDIEIVKALMNYRNLK